MNHLPRSILFLLSVFISILQPGFAEQNDLNIELGFLPGLSETPEKGPFVDILKAIDDYYSAGVINITVVPYDRGIQDLLSGKIDFYLPVAKSPTSKEEDGPYAWADEVLGTTLSMVIYSNVDRPVTANMIREAAAKGGEFPLQIEAVTSYKSFFGFPTIIAFDPGHSLAKVSVKRIDCALYMMDMGDAALKIARLKNIHREFFFLCTTAIAIPRGPRGARINKILTNTLGRLKKTARYQVLFKFINSPYDDWQPKDMDW